MFLTRFCTRKGLTVLPFGVCVLEFVNYDIPKRIYSRIKDDRRPTWQSRKNILSRPVIVRLKGSSVNAKIYVHRTSNSRRTNTFPPCLAKQQPSLTQPNKTSAILAMAPKKSKKTADSINSRLALVMKSGKVTLGYSSTLKALRSGKVRYNGQNQCRRLQLTVVTGQARHHCTRILRPTQTNNRELTSSRLATPHH